MTDATAQAAPLPTDTDMKAPIDGRFQVFQEPDPRGETTTWTLAEEGRVCLTSDITHGARPRIETLSLHAPADGAPCDVSLALLLGVCRDSGTDAVVIADHLAAQMASWLHLYGITVMTETPDGARQIVPRAAIMQCARLFMPRRLVWPDLRVGENAQPIRPPAPSGQVYRRVDPATGHVVTLRVLDLEQDLQRFHTWMNAPRIAEFWELSGDLAFHREYLEKQIADPHTYAVITEIDGEAAGYFELYWALEDRIAPYYDAAPFDRGWHALIGNNRLLGRKRTHAQFAAVNHYCFLEDPRTERLVGEPRADHPRIIGYAKDVAFYQDKVFDFPHKRAALMVCPRRAFFERVVL